MKIFAYINHIECMQYRCIRFVIGCLLNQFCDWSLTCPLEAHLLIVNHKARSVSKDRGLNVPKIKAWLNDGILYCIQLALGAQMILTTVGQGLLVFL